MKELAKPRLMLVSCLLLTTAAFAGAPPPAREAPLALQESELRCGWFSNPTPANASLYDRHGEWIIGTQGSYQAEGDWPEFGRGQWVRTNGNYGYGCACLRVRVNHNNHRVLEIENAEARPLGVCRRDRSLRRWRRMFR